MAEEPLSASREAADVAVVLVAEADVAPVLQVVVAAPAAALAADPAAVVAALFLVDPQLRVATAVAVASKSDQIV